ncbi:type II secretion system F family protein [Salininema proteolyticum]|uniref:Type II secretion system F family protein n=1 Tax=Salininema proteolyticum TaxID=1607685 RepID=A0ABV8TXF0_9ACTN
MTITGPIVHTSDSADHSRPESEPPRSTPMRRLIPIGIALTCLALSPDLLGLFLAGLLGWTSHRFLHRTTRPKADPSEWAWALSLVAAALRTGAPVNEAFIYVSEKRSDDIGLRLQRFGSALGLGSSPSHAAALLHGLPAVSRLAAGIERSQSTGSALADSVAEIADSILEDHRYEVDRRSARAGISLLAPTFLCFLPAFALTGISPTVMGLLRQLHF